jgi:fatty-acyl-CoA synthase
MDRRMVKNPSNRAWQRALELTAPIGRDPYCTLNRTIEDLAGGLGDAPALLSAEGALTYDGLGKQIDRYTRWALTLGLESGDVVCLFMPNCPDYIAIWLGLTRIGCIVSLINTNLRSGSLEHVIAAVSPKHVIVGASLAEGYESVMPPLNGEVRFWAHGGDIGDLARIDVEAPTDARISPEVLHARRPSIRDRALYLYTSGTTGLPKAVPVSHYRLMQWSFWFAGMIDVQPDDRMYNCLPMYHSVGGIVANCAMLVAGGSVVIRERFSTSRFWSDVAEWDCTLFQYIGEMCRYLANSAPHPQERSHRIRLAVGNGLRRDIWDVMLERFEIPRILEFYASTEGNISLYNCEGQPGAIGRFPPFLAHRFALALVKCDPDTGTALRGEDGFCIRCDAGEPGEALGKISDDAASLTGRFEGYLDPAASEAKILRNVFAEGDAWYRTGDLMRRDKAGFYYFVDRMGDTFRWKGENVSTEEVAAVVTSCPGVTSAVVYGVSVARNEGRAGMAAIVVDDRFDLGRFHAVLAESLPDYARPLFLRICREIDVTGTFKFQKQDLAREGFDPSLVSDPLYLNDRRRCAFVALDLPAHERIANGALQV